MNIKITEYEGGYNLGISYHGKSEVFPNTECKNIPELFYHLVEEFFNWVKSPKQI